MFELILPTDNPNEGRIKINHNFAHISMSGGTVTTVSGGTNINVSTGGTLSNYTVNLDSDISLNSGSLNSISATTIYSGSTDLSSLIGNPQNLSEVLAVGNTTSDGQTIQAENGGGELNLRYGTNGRVALTTDSGGLAEQGLYMDHGSNYQALFAGGYYQILELANGSGDIVLYNTSGDGRSVQIGVLNGVGVYDEIDEIKVTNNITTNATTGDNDKSAVIVSSRNATINAGVTNTAIVGGANITATQDDSLYTQNARLAENSGVIYSAGTDLYNIFGAGGNETLSQTLNFGNTTSDGQTIQAENGGGYLNLREGGDSIVLFDNSGGTFSDSGVYIENEYLAIFTNGYNTYLELDHRTRPFSQYQVDGAGGALQIGLNSSELTLEDNTSQDVFSSAQNKKATFLTTKSSSISSGVTESSIVAGSGHTINSDLRNVSIIGGANITATTSDSVYVPNLNIGTVGSNPPLINLGLDSNGFVVTGDTSLLLDAFGISDSGGTYTYYSDFQTAINAASSGQTVEMFADVTVDSSSTVTLKDGVNINLNGHKYENINSGTVELITLPDNITVNIFNGMFKRSGGPSLTTTNAALDGYNSPNSELYLEGVIFYNITSISYYGNASVYGGTFISDSTGGYGFLSNSGRLQGIKIKSYAANRISNSTILQNSSLLSTNSVGLNVWGGNVLNCSIVSLGGVGVTTGTGTSILKNCSVYSNGGNAVDFSSSASSIIGCTFYSSAGLAGLITAVKKIENCNFYSTVSYGAQLSGVNTQANNCTFESTALQGVRLVNDAKIKNCYVKSSFDDPTGHAVICINATTTGFEIFNCNLETVNNFANAINATVVTNFGYWGGNTFKGMSTPVNSTNPNQQINTPDAYGNMLIG